MNVARVRAICHGDILRFFLVPHSTRNARVHASRCATMCVLSYSLCCSCQQWDWEEISRLQMLIAGFKSSSCPNCGHTLGTPVGLPTPLIPSVTSGGVLTVSRCRSRSCLVQHQSAGIGSNGDREQRRYTPALPMAPLWTVLSPRSRLEKIWIPQCRTTRL